MLDWILLHFRGVIDWGIVFLVVFFGVFLFQFMINFFKGPDDLDDEE